MVEKVSNIYSSHPERGVNWLLILQLPRLFPSSTNSCPLIGLCRSCDTLLE